VVLPYFAAFMAVICYAAIGPLMKRSSIELPSFLFIGLSATMMAIGAFILLFLTEGRHAFVLPERSKCVGMVAIVVINLAGWYLYLFSIRAIPVAHYDMIAGLGIVATAVFAALLLGEPIYLRYAPAILLIIAGLYIAIGPDLRPK
jgi:drug/metabolite transporter (DMT)-like permease